MSKKPTTTMENFDSLKGPKVAVLVVVLIVATIALFTVVNPEDVDAKSTITLSKSVVNINENSSDTVVATFSEYQEGYSVTVTSNNNVVTVSASAISNKQSTITVTSGSIPSSSTSSRITATITIVYNDTTSSPPTKTFTVNVKIGVTSVDIVDKDGKSITSKITLNTTGDKKETTVKAKVLPDKAYNKSVTWTSSDPSVATISSDGKIEAKKEGTTSIKATSSDNPLKTDTITVEVKDVHVTSVTLEPKELNLNIGDKATVKATILPADATNLNATVSVDKSSMLKIVSKTASKNEITIVVEATGDADGVAKLKVESEDQKKTAECTVNVKRVPVTGVELKKDSITLEVDSTETVAYEIKPSNATDKRVTWSSSNTAVAEVNTNTGAITGKSPGTAIITIKTVEGNFTDMCDVTVLRTYTIMADVDQDPTTGKGQVQNITKAIEDIKTASAKGLYPTFYIDAPKCKSVFMTSDLIKTLQSATEGTLQLEYAIGYVLFDNDSLKKVDTSGQKVGIGLTQLDSSAYPKFGACYVYEMNMYKDDAVIATSFGGSGPLLAITHKLLDGEDAAKLKVAYVVGEDKAILMRDYKFVTDETVTPPESAVVFELSHTSKFLYMFHDSEYVKNSDYDMVIVALFFVLAVALGGGVGFLVFNPKASAAFMDLFEKDGDRSPRKPRFPRKPKNKDQFDNFGGNNYY